MEHNEAQLEEKSDDHWYKIKGSLNSDLTQTGFGLNKLNDYKINKYNKQLNRPKSKNTLLFIYLFITYFYL